MKKNIIYIAMLLLAMMGAQSCSNDWAQPPMLYPEQEGNGSGATPYNVGAALVAIYSGNYSSRSVYVKGIVSQIDGFEPSYGNITYYISNDGQQTNQLEVYRGLYLNGERFTSADQLNLGDEVIVCCQLTLYNNSVAETNQGAFIVSINGSAYEWADPVDPAGSGLKDDPYNVAAALNVIYSPDIPTEKIYVKGIVSKIDEIGGSFGNATYYISDTGKAAEQLEVYRGYGLGGKKFASESDLKVGDEVIVYGVVVLFNSTPEFTTGSQLYMLNGKTDDSGTQPSTPDTPATPAGDAVYTGLTANAEGWTIDNGALPEALTYVWKWDDTYTCLKASAYVGGANHATSAFAYLPFDLAGYAKASAVFDHCYRYGADIPQSLTFVVREQGAAEWTAITIPNWNDGTKFSFVNSGEIDLTAYAGKKIDVGFHYTSTDAAAATWEVKNFNIIATK